MEARRLKGSLVRGMMDEEYGQWWGINECLGSE